MNVEERRKAARDRYHANKSDPVFMECLRERNRAYRKRMREEKNPKFLASKSRLSCARAKRKRDNEPEWVKKQLAKTREWRRKNKPKYECEALAKKRYFEKNKEKQLERGRAFSKTDEGRKYFREYARKQAGYTPESFEAMKAVRKLKRTLYEIKRKGKKNEKQNG